MSPVYYLHVRVTRPKFEFLPRVLNLGVVQVIAKTRAHAHKPSSSYENARTHTNPVCRLRSVRCPARLYFSHFIYHAHPSRDPICAAVKWKLIGKRMGKWKLIVDNTDVAKCANVAKLRRHGKRWREEEKNPRHTRTHRARPQCHCPTSTRQADNARLPPRWQKMLPYGARHLDWRRV